MMIMQGFRLSRTSSMRRPARRGRSFGVTFAALCGLFLVIEAFVGATPAAAQFVCTCPADFDPWTNCIEARVERQNSDSNGACYYVIVYNHQSSALTARCNAYNTEQYLTFAFDTACYNYRGMHLQITPVTLNETYTPPIIRWWTNIGGTWYTTYDRTSAHVPKIVWQRRLNADNSANYFTRCSIDTFAVCVDCIDSTPIRSVRS